MTVWLAVAGGGRSKTELLGRMCTVAARSSYFSHSASGCDFVLCIMSAGIYVLHERLSPTVQREGNRIKFIFKNRMLASLREV